MKLSKKILLSITIILLFIILLTKVIKVQNVILKKIFVKKYNEYVTEYSKEYNIDELLVYSIIKAESNFDPNVVSKSGAVGLMQIMESTADEIALNLKNETVNKEDLLDPKINIMFGVSYFSDLLKEYNGNQLLALSAYNAGKGNVKKWIEQGIIKPDGSDIENIPFKETNNYVRKIIRNYKIYTTIYSEK